MKKQCPQKIPPYLSAFLQNKKTIGETMVFFEGGSTDRCGNKPTVYEETHRVSAICENVYKLFAAGFPTAVKK